MFLPKRSALRPLALATALMFFASCNVSITADDDPKDRADASDDNGGKLKDSDELLADVGNAPNSKLKDIPSGAKEKVALADVREEFVDPKTGSLKPKGELSQENIKGLIESLVGPMNSLTASAGAPLGDYIAHSILERTKTDLVAAYRSALLLRNQENQQRMFKLQTNEESGDEEGSNVPDCLDVKPSADEIDAFIDAMDDLDDAGNLKTAQDFLATLDVSVQPKGGASANCVFGDNDNMSITGKAGANGSVTFTYASGKEPPFSKLNADVTVSAEGFKLTQKDENGVIAADGSVHGVAAYDKSANHFLLDVDVDLDGVSLAFKSDNGGDILEQAVGEDEEYSQQPSLVEDGSDSYYNDSSEPADDEGMSFYLTQSDDPNGDDFLEVTDYGDMTGDGSYYPTDENYDSVNYSDEQGDDDQYYGNPDDPNYQGGDMYTTYGSGDFQEEEPAGPVDVKADVNGRLAFKAEETPEKLMFAGELNLEGASFSYKTDDDEVQVTVDNTLSADASFDDSSIGILFDLSNGLNGSSKGSSKFSFGVTTNVHLDAVARGSGMKPEAFLGKGGGDGDITSLSYSFVFDQSGDLGLTKKLDGYLEHVLASRGKVDGKSIDVTVAYSPAFKLDVTDRQFLDIEDVALRGALEVGLQSTDVDWGGGILKGEPTINKGVAFASIGINFSTANKGETIPLTLIARLPIVKNEPQTDDVEYLIKDADGNFFAVEFEDSDEENLVISLTDENGKTATLTVEFDENNSDVYHVSVEFEGTTVSYDGSTFKIFGALASIAESAGDGDDEDGGDSTPAPFAGGDHPVLPRNRF